MQQLVMSKKQNQISSVSWKQYIHLKQTNGDDNYSHVMWVKEKAAIPEILILLLTDMVTRCIPLKRAYMLPKTIKEFHFNVTVSG